MKMSLKFDNLESLLRNILSGIVFDEYLLDCRIVCSSSNELFI